MTSTMHFDEKSLAIKIQAFGRGKGLETWASLTLRRSGNEFNFYTEDPNELEEIAVAAKRLANDLRIAKHADLVIANAPELVTA